jgi:hypothetical protein
MTPYSLVCEQNVSEEHTTFVLRVETVLTLKIEAICSSEMLVHISRLTGRVT